jgi:glutathione synthase
MDPIGSIHLKKDSTLALLREAQARGWELHYLEQGDLFVRDGTACGRTRPLSLTLDHTPWFKLGAERDLTLSELDVILMRKDPPFDLEYLYSTQILELAERAGVLVVNKPQSLRDANEKLAVAWFPQCAPPTLVTRSKTRLRAFLVEQRDIILKPLDAMGGASVFRLRQDDPNINVVIETLTARETRQAMAQRYLPEIAQGDKRILLIDGAPVTHALARLPAPGETRANLAAGGHGEGRALTDRDRWICAEVGPALRARGILFAGLDVIGDYLTEVNITSPTCIRELDALYGLNIGGQLLDAIAARRA